MIPRRSVLTGLTGLSASVAIGRVAPAQERASGVARETIAVLGTGKLGSTLGKRLAALRYPIIYGSRSPDGEHVKALVRDSGFHTSAASLKVAAERANIIVFALPWDAVKELVTDLGDLSKKLIIDPMNTQLKIVDHYPYRPEASTSVSEQLQSWIPDSHVVKAFNTILSNNLADPARAGGPISIPLAGADQGSKDRVARLISELGLYPVDTGPLIAARYIEDLLRLEVGYVMYNKGRMFEFYMRPVPTP